MNAPTRDLKAKVWKRDPHDFYVEEPRASRSLFEVEKFVGDIWDPACGIGNVLNAAEAAGYKLSVSGTDIVKRCDRWWFRGERDFLKWDSQPLAQNIVCNPPFYRGKGAEAFIVKALDLARGKVAIFAELTFLASDGRAKCLWSKHPPTRVYSISPRVSCPPGEWLAAGNKPGGGTADWCWIVWDVTARHSATTFHWLRAPA